MGNKEETPGIIHYGSLATKIPLTLSASLSDKQSSLKCLTDSRRVGMGGLKGKAFQNIS